MNSTKYLLTLLSVILIGTSVLSQSSSVKKDLSEGNKFFKKEFYRDALPYFERVAKADPDNYEVKYKRAVCYLNTFKKKEALELLAEVEKNAPEVSPHVQFWFGRVDHMFYEWDAAIEHYNKYKLTLSANDTRVPNVDRYIKQCEYGKQLVRRPQEYKIENMGNVINSIYSDHSPIISEDGNTFIFTSRRIEGTGDKEAPDGSYFEDIFVSEKKDGEWQEAHSIGKYLNTTGHEASIQLINDGNTLIIYKYKKGGDFYVSEKENGKWTPPKRMENINSGDYESDAHITPDGKFMYYSSDHSSRDGNLDLFITESDGNGGWKEPVPITELNTDQDEDSPFLSKDGKTLFFSSRGYNSMGGYDIFKSEFNESTGKWGYPQNLGHPVNSPDNDIYYYRDSDDKYAYMSSFRLDSYGEKDIYKIIPIPHVFVKGKVLAKGSDKPVKDVLLSFKRVVYDDSTVVREDSSNESADYSVNVLSASRYTVAMVRDNDTLSKEEFNIELVKNEGDIINKNFYIELPSEEVPADTLIASSDEPEDRPSTSEWKFKNIYYGFDRSSLNDQAIKELNYVAKIMIAYPDPEFRVRVIGHTDSKGSEEYNLRLSKRRAEAALNYLLEKGVERSRLEIAYKGESDPLERNVLPDGQDNPEGRAKNRRVEFKLIEN